MIISAIQWLRYMIKLCVSALVTMFTVTWSLPLTFPPPFNSMDDHSFSKNSTDNTWFIPTLPPSVMSKKHSVCTGPSTVNMCNSRTHTNNNGINQSPYTCSHSRLSTGWLNDTVWVTGEWNLEGRMVLGTWTQLDTRHSDINVNRHMIRHSVSHVMCVRGWHRWYRLERRVCWSLSWLRKMSRFLMGMSYRSNRDCCSSGTIAMTSVGVHVLVGVFYLWFLFLCFVNSALLVCISPKKRGGCSILSAVDCE